ncbi:FeoA family protein [Candidatus Leptofilum sp.]|uniref:FeoA family protein n=1 Tax=Candidatus Leptofilum sp. TaxID=3241576 RepID=UPI003B5B56D1
MGSKLSIPLRVKEAPTGPMMPLTMVNRGEAAIVRKVKGCGTVRQRLLDLGLNPGATVQVLKNESASPMIIAVKGDGRLALDRKMTHRVMVTTGAGG